MHRRPPFPPARRAAQVARGFTLLELLIVIGIIAALAVLTVPSFKNVRGGSVMAAASRQLLDDLGLARLKAITERTTVYVIFVPPFSTAEIASLSAVSSGINPNTLQSLYHGQLTTYALFTNRRVGAQPGATQLEYLTEWKSLPEGVFIPRDKFGSTAYDIQLTRAGTNTGNYLHVLPFANSASFPFPTETNAILAGPPVVLAGGLPYIAFNGSGQVSSSVDEVIPLTHGSVFLRNPANTIDEIETPPGEHTNNYTAIVINWLTGRSRVARPEF
ncbi:MAG: prepilin-type N-terminal cleavage/methylation domain-containing protein [Verrucomicrobia bacterium]|nr:prepilin-type N-terminal cleavage/methylation domain-containing protein [Verrucomicrobiota bacterium]